MDTFSCKLYIVCKFVIVGKMLIKKIGNVFFVYRQLNLKRNKRTIY